MFLAVLRRPKTKTWGFLWICNQKCLKGVIFSTSRSQMGPFGSGISI
eukprot:UN00740